ncbi:hypothetical protein SLA2020_170630 [Shorea laevis]
MELPNCPEGVFGISPLMHNHLVDRVSPENQTDGTAREAYWKGMKDRKEKSVGLRWRCERIESETEGQRRRLRQQ